VAVQGGSVDIRLGGTTGCASCDAGKGCGAGVFGRLLKRKPVVIRLENTVHARPGQPVMVGIPETLFLRLVTRLYLLPVLAGVAGSAAGYALASAASMGSAGLDAVTLLCGVAAGLAAIFSLGKTGGEFPASSIVHLLRVAATEESVN
jgi:sigma-E factor negative regulatory protein RseC